MDRIPVVGTPTANGAATAAGCIRPRSQPCAWRFITATPRHRASNDVGRRGPDHSLQRDNVPSSGGTASDMRRRHGNDRRGQIRAGHQMHRLLKCLGGQIIRLRLREPADDLRPSAFPPKPAARRVLARNREAGQRSSARRQRLVATTLQMHNARRSHARLRSKSVPELFFLKPNIAPPTHSTELDQAFPIA